MVTKSPSPPHVLLSLIATSKIILILLAAVLFAIPFWLDLERVHSAPAEVASPPPAPFQPSVSLIDVPPEVLIGEEFKFKVKFQSPTGSPFGYGPFIDLVLEAGGANITKPPQTSTCSCDGINFVSAKLLDVIGGPTDVTPPPPYRILTSPCGGVSNTNVQHPFGSFTTSGIQPLTVPPGSQLITIEFPFGSFTPAQPSITVEVTAKVSNLADYNYLLKISARGGFRYGGDALNNPSIDPPVFSDENPPGTQVTNSTQWAAQAITKPTVMKINKEYIGPEDETATGPNYPHQYSITVDIANTQVISNLKVHDFLPNNMQYQGGVVVKIGTSVATVGPFCSAQYALTKQPPTSAAQNTPTNELEVSFCNAITGTLATNDVTITFKFFIPEFTASPPGLPVLPNCAPVFSNNDIKAEGDWTPQDPCDQSPIPPVHVVSDVKPIDHKLADKCLAIQKKVTWFNLAGPKPGDLLRYDLSFQVSDYKSIGNLVVTDFLADGQVLTGPAPTITISDQFATRANIFPPIALSNTPAPAGAAQYCPPPLQAPQGGRRLTFNVSQAMGILASLVPRWNAGILTGGYAAGPGLPNGAAAGTIRFYAKITDAFQFPVPTGHDKYVDKDDPINNCVAITGKVYKNITGPSPIHARNSIPNLYLGPAQDGSATHLTIVTDKPVKSIYAVKRGGLFICGPSGGPCSNFPNPPQEVRPGDEVTFRIQKTIPSSDAEKLTIQDFLPLPKFDVRDPDANGTLGPVWTLTNSTCTGFVPGNVCLLATDTLHSLPVSPTVLQSNPTNSFTLDYATFFATNNLPRKIDFVFTATVTNRPAADGLFLMNVAQECENDTFSNVPHCQTTIAQVKVREPKLSIKKGAVASDNPHGVFTPALSPTGVWKPYGSSCPDFQNGPITSSTLGGLINSNLSNVDANDHVTFGIAIENSGGAPACEIELADIIPLDPLDKPSCFDPDYSSLCVTDGNGTPIPFTTAIGGHGRRIIKFPPGFCLAPGSPSNIMGTNIAMITFNAQLHSDITPGCCDNVAQLLHYTSQLGGPDFVNGGFTPPFSDAATVCVNPTLTKSLVATSEPHTAGSNVAIGEIARYGLAVVVPEGGVMPNFQVTDALPAGMKFLNDGSARLAFISTGGTGISHPLPLISSNAFNMSGNLPLSPTQTIPGGVIFGGATCGAPITFNLGNIQNNDNDADLEYIVIEFNAVVCDVASNQNGVTLPNTFSVSINGIQIATSNSLNVQVVEPHLDLHKTYSPPNPVAPASFTLTFSNNLTTDAFNVHLTDTLPPGLTLSTIPAPTVNVSTTGCAAPQLSISGNTLTVDVPQLVNSPSCTVTLKFYVQGQFCGTNTAQVTYSSLPGGVNSNPAAPVGTQPNPTGSVTACSMPNKEDCERIYNAFAQVSSPTSCHGCTNQVVQTPGMVAWWPLDEMNGATVVNDIAGFNNQGVPKPGSPLGLPTAPNAVPGAVGGAIQFDSNFQQNGPNIEVPDHPEINFGTGNFSIDAWVLVQKPPSIYLHSIVDKLQLNSTGTQGTGYALSLVSSFATGAQLQFVMGTGGPLVGYSGPNAPSVPFGTWTHIVVTVNRSSGTVVFYVNGIPVPTTGGPMPGGSTTNSVPLLIGESRPPGPMQAAITLDELEMFSRALTPSEIQSIVTAVGLGKCKCWLASNEAATCNSNGTFNYAVTLTNLMNTTASTVVLSPISNITITPSTITIPPLPPGASTTVTVTISGPAAVGGANVCFIVGLTGIPPAPGCRVQHCIILPSCQMACASQPANMISWWPLNEQGGATVISDIKGGHNGAPSSGSLPAWNAPGKVGGALFVGDHVIVPDDPSLKFGTGNFSVDTWFGSGQPYLIGGIVDKLDIAAKKGYALYIQNDHLKLVMGNGTAFQTYTSIASVGIVSGSTTWHHVAVTVDRINAKAIFYIDGVPGPAFPILPASIDISTSSTLFVGGSRQTFPPTSCVCEYLLDEVEIFNAVISANDILRIFNAGPSGKCP